MKTYIVKINANGTKRRYSDDKLDCGEHGPAVEYSNGNKHWYLNGKIHRIDGPYMPIEAINWLDKYKLKHKLVQI